MRVGTGPSPGGYRGISLHQNQTTTAMQKTEKPEGRTDFGSLVKTIDIEELGNLCSEMPLYVESSLKNHTLVPIDFAKFKSDYAGHYKKFKVDIHTHSLYLEAMYLQ